MTLLPDPSAPLAADEAARAFDLLFDADLSDEAIAGFLVTMARRGETATEIAAAARAMRARMIPVDAPEGTIDVCGTGGDGLHTLNISTAVGFVAAGGGLKVAKHGNRAITSKSGTADVLTALGVNIDATREQQRNALDKAGICFLFAQAHHGAMKHVSPIRQQLGFRTIFNLLGPLTNPAGAKRQVVGVSAPRFVEPIAKALGALGAERAWSVHGSGMDELTTTGETEVAEWRDGVVRLFKITPEAVGLPRASLADLTGGDPAFNAAALTRLFDGEEGPYRDIVLLNAAAAFLVADRVETLVEGITLAGEVIDSGRAKAALAGLVAATHTDVTA